MHTAYRVSHLPFTLYKKQDKRHFDGNTESLQKKFHGLTPIEFNYCTLNEHIVECMKTIIIISTLKFLL